MHVNLCIVTVHVYKVQKGQGESVLLISAGSGSGLKVQGLMPQEGKCNHKNVLIMIPSGCVCAGQSAMRHWTDTDPTQRHPPPPKRAGKADLLRL